jgi:hypothetical protein
MIHPLELTLIILVSVFLFRKEIKSLWQKK